jgi:hypothetical protein
MAMKRLFVPGRNGFLILWISLVVYVLSAAPDFSGLHAKDDQLQRLARIDAQIGILDASRDLSSVLRDIKHHIRISNNIEDLTNQPGSARLLRDSAGLLRQLSSEMVKLKALDRLQKNQNNVRQITAGVDLVVTMTRAVNEAETSSGAQKLRDLNTVFGHTETLLPLISILGSAISVNPVLGAYFTVMRKAIDNIADSAEIIEREKEKRNAAIRFASDSIGPLKADPEDKHERLIEQLDAALAEKRAARRAILREMRKPAFEAVEAAEKACRDELKLTPAAVRKLRNNIRVARFALQSGWRSLQGMEAELPTWKNDFNAYTEKRKLLAGRPTNPVIKAQIDRLQGDINNAKRKIKALQTKIKASLRELKLAYRGYLKARKSVRKFNKCVADKLKGSRQADNTFLQDYFPEYVENNRYWRVSEVKRIRSRLKIGKKKTKVVCRRRSMVEAMNCVTIIIEAEQ